MKSNTILLIGAAIAVYFFMQKSSTTQTGAPVPVAITDAQKRAAIISWWQTSTPPANQASDNGQFADIITSISTDEITAIYTYLFTYVQQGTRPPVNSVLYNQIQTISNEYGILS